MKKYILAAAACAALLTVGCTKQESAPELSKVTTLEATLSPLTKTAINGVKVSWDADDAIDVNGVCSSAINTEGEGASFEFADAVSAPYCAVCPAMLYYNDDTVWLSEELFLEQTTDIPLAAYSESGTSLSFHPLTAVLKIPVSGDDGLKLSAVTLKGNDGEQVSGPFGINYTDAALTEGIDASYQTIVIDCEGTALGSTPLDIYISIPPGAYGKGFEVEFTTTDGLKVVKGTNARTLKAGQLTAMPEVSITSATISGGIASAEDFAAFRDAVNAGEPLDKWRNSDGKIALLADIDLTSYSTWTPVGNVTSTGNGNNACAPQGASFSDVFDGGGHTIKFGAGSASIANGCTWGIFGSLVCATVKDLNVECSGVIFSAESAADAGVLAGTVYASSISNVNVTGSIESYGNNTDNKRFAIGGIAGFVFSDDEDGESIIEDCTVELTVTGGSGMNTKAGATGVQFGGIAGFATTASGANVFNRIKNCTAKGKITLNVGRSCGILATANCNTVIENCTNYADQTNDFVNGRIGNVVCYLKTNCGLVDCVNYGNLTTSNKQTTAGGLAALLDIDSAYIEGGANYGTILGANTSYLGLICANCSKFDHISDVTVSGRIGVYGGEMYSVDSENFLNYIGTFSATNAAKITGLTYVAP